MKFRSAFAVLAMTVAVTACGELPFQDKTPPAEPTAPTPAAPPAVSPIDSPIEVGAEGTPRATAESSTMATKMFRASGSGWTVTAAGERAVYERPGAKSTAVSVRRMSYNRGVEFIGTMNGSVFALNIQAAECKTGEGSTPFTAKLRVGTQRMTGCATATDTMPKAQVTASAAKPKPKSTAKPKPAAKPAEPAVTPAAATPAVTTPATPAVTETTPATTTTPTPATTTPAPAATPAVTPAATPEPAATTPAPATEPAAPASGSTTGVPAPQLILPPTPPAASQ